MPRLWSNNASATLASAITNSATSLPLAAGKGALFPSPTGSDYFIATLETTAGVREIVRCTARATDTLTIVRAQEGSTASAFAAGDVCDLRVTIDALNEFAQKGSTMTTVKKLLNEARTANVTNTADNTLVAALAIGQYLVRVVAMFSTANAAMDFKYDTTFLTGTATVPWYLRRHITAGAVAGTDNENVAIGTGLIASTAVAATTTGIARVEIEMTIDVTVAGTFQFRWAQNTSDAGALTVLRGSYLQHVVT